MVEGISIGKTVWVLEDGVVYKGYITSRTDEKVRIKFDPGKGRSWDYEKSAIKSSGAIALGFLLLADKVTSGGMVDATVDALKDLESVLSGE